MTKELKKTLSTVKDLLLFDSSWKKRKTHKEVKKLPKKAVERILIYRELIQSSIFDLISRIYPYTLELIKKDKEKLLPVYLEQFPPKSPILNKVAESFPLFIANQKQLIKKYPFIYELATYEWLELEVADREEQDEGEGDKGQGILNPIHEICRFKYDIPLIVELIKNNKPLNKISQKQTSILIYRNPKTLEVKFFQLSPASLGYIELLSQGFNDDFITMILSEVFKIDENRFDEFRKEIGKFVKELKRNKIII